MRYSFCILQTLYVLIISCQCLNAQKEKSVDCGYIGHTSPIQEVIPCLNCDQNFDSFLINHRHDMVPQNDKKLKVLTNIVFVQRANGEGNFRKDNEKHMEFWAKVFKGINDKYNNLVDRSCSCNNLPTHYNKLNVEFCPNYVEYRSEDLWNHNNYSAIKWSDHPNSHTQRVHQAIVNDDEYKVGFDWIVTVSKPAWDAVFIEGVDPYDPNNYPRQGADWYGGQWYSDYGSNSNLTFPATWHSPDLYTNYAIETEIYGNLEATSTLDKAIKQGAHEYGHYFNLGHKNCNTSSGNCYNNIMNQEKVSTDNGCPKEYDSFTGCQVRSAYRVEDGYESLQPYTD